LQVKKIFISINVSPTRFLDFRNKFFYTLIDVPRLHGYVMYYLHADRFFSLSAFCVIIMHDDVEGSGVGMGIQKSCCCSL